MITSFYPAIYRATVTPKAAVTFGTAQSNDEIESALRKAVWTEYIRQGGHEQKVNLPLMRTTLKDNQAIQTTSQLDNVTVKNGLDRLQIYLGSQLHYLARHQKSLEDTKNRILKNIPTWQHIIQRGAKGIVVFDVDETVLGNAPDYYVSLQEIVTLNDQELKTLGESRHKAAGQKHHHFAFQEMKDVIAALEKAKIPYVYVTARLPEGKEITKANLRGEALYGKYCKGVACLGKPEKLEYLQWLQTRRKCQFTKPPAILAAVGDNHKTDLIGDPTKDYKIHPIGYSIIL